jgi:pimeloyl-ACP methyl ester carboxylesterase
MTLRHCRTRTGAVVLAVAFLAMAGGLAACTGGSGGSGGSGSLGDPGANLGPPAGTTLTWRPCAAAAAGAPDASQLRCALLQVPVNYADPAGRKISLALSEIPATAPVSQRQGVLLVNPGGPGASGLSLAASVASGLTPGVAAKYDIVGFDTRGVGSSVPALTCDSAFFSKPRPAYVPASQAAEQAEVNRARAYAAACEKKFGWLLPYMTTENLARDMDSIRIALRQPKISYYGVSYGTYLGQVYATMFPHRVRRMVLDSVVDPDGIWWQDNIEQDYAFQGRVSAFYSWIAANDSVYHLGGTTAEVLATVNGLMARLARHPVTTDAGPLIGADELSDTILVGGYSNSFWPPLASAMASYLHQHSASQLTGLYEEAGQQDENEFAVYTAVECADVSWPRSWAYWNTATRKVYARAPFYAWGNTWFNAACAFWPVKGPSSALAIKGSGLPPILMLQGSLDAATPYQGALAARRLLPTARMVVVERGGNHGQSLAYPPNNCVNGYLDRYLADGSLPGGSGLVSATCAALPAPRA